MSYVYPAMPLQDPSTPERDGVVDLRFADDALHFKDPNGVWHRIGYLAVAKGGVKVQPGSDSDLNRVQITFLAGQIEFDDDCPGWTEIVIAQREASARVEGA